MKAYQISKTKTHYWWTATVDADRLPEEDHSYKWVTTEQEAKELSGKKRQL